MAGPVSTFQYLDACAAKPFAIRRVEFDAGCFLRRRMRLAHLHCICSAVKYITLASAADPDPMPKLTGGMRPNLALAALVTNFASTKSNQEMHHEFW